MESHYDYKKYGILYVDDEAQSLKYFQKAFGDKFRIYTARNAEEGFRVLCENQDEIGIVISDQRMPGEQGVQLLEKAKNLNPQLGRILVTAFSDFDSAIQAINDGGIHKYVCKPWELDDLELTLKNGLKDFILKTHHENILNEKVLLLYQQIIADRQLNLGIVSSGFSHHLRNLLVTIKTFLDFIPIQLREANLDPEQIEKSDYWANLYQKAAKDLKKIDNLLVQLSDLTANIECRFDGKVMLNQVIDDVIKTRRDALATKKITVSNDVPASLSAMVVDKKRFYQLFELLFDDEIQNLLAGSKINIEAREGPSSDERGPMIEIKMRDDGNQLPNECIESVFDPFFVRSNNPQEFGTKLVTCYFIVYLHNGDISARNNHGKGMTFTLHLPVNCNKVSATKNQDGFMKKMILNEFFLERTLR